MEAENLEAQTVETCPSLVEAKERGIRRVFMAHWPDGTYMRTEPGSDGDLVFNGSGSPMKVAFEQEGAVFLPYCGPLDKADTLGDKPEGSQHDALLAVAENITQLLKHPAPGLRSWNVMLLRQFCILRDVLMENYGMPENMREWG